MNTTLFGRGMSTVSDTATAVTEAVRAAREHIDTTDAISFAVVLSAPDYDASIVVDTMQELIGDVPLVGATTAGEFTDEGVIDGGLVVALIGSAELTAHTSLAEGASTDVFGTTKAAVDGLPDVDSLAGEHTAAITFHNGLAGKGEQITLVTRQLLGAVPLVGGSAGDDLAMEETTVFTENGVSTDGIVIALLSHDKPFAIAANHGHTALSETYTVTDADENVVYELDGRSAFEVWKQEIAEVSDREYSIDVDALTADDDEFDMLLNQFELGIETDAGGYKIRWPAMTDSTDGPLKFATGLPEGSEVRIMHSPKEAQIDSARTAARKSLNRFGGDEVAGALVFDCVCRGLILGDEFSDAVDEIANELGAPLAGLETYGEVSMPLDATSGYHNTTTSLLLIPA